MSSIDSPSKADSAKKDVPNAGDPSASNVSASDASEASDNLSENVKDNISIATDEMLSLVQACYAEVPKNDRIAAQRLAFNQKAFSYDVKTGEFPPGARTSIQLNDDTYKYFVRIFTSSPEKRKKFLKDRSNYNRVSRMEVNRIDLPNGDKKLFLERKKKDPTGKRGSVILPMSGMFDAIYMAHKKVGHLRVASTYLNLRKIVWNHTREQATAFIATCPVCIEKAPTVKPMKGAAKAISSVKFRDRAQVDLIDMTSNAKKNQFGILMKYIVTIKDHWTGFTIIDCIPRKRAAFVAEILAKYFSLFGFPQILHTDNGREFTAKEVLAKMKKMSPHLTTVHGRPRTPRDQGSVERANQVVKNMLYAFEREQRINGDKPNWTLAISHVNACINSKEQDGKHGISSYEVVFNMPFEDTDQILPSDLRQCETVKDRIKIKKNQISMTC
jgi:hypothetical protein